MGPHVDPGPPPCLLWTTSDSPLNSHTGCPEVGDSHPPATGPERTCLPGETAVWPGACLDVSFAARTLGSPTSHLHPQKGLISAVPTCQQQLQLPGPVL